jgi:hypothetical protein
MKIERRNSSGEPGAIATGSYHSRSVLFALNETLPVAIAPGPLRESIRANRFISRFSTHSLQAPAPIELTTS